MTSSANVTRRQLSLGSHASRDSWSGWRTITYTPSTIEMVIVTKGSPSRLITLAGSYPKLDALGETPDPCNIGDQILAGDGTYWVIEGIEKIKWLDGLICYKYHMNHVRLYQADFGSTTWSKNRGSDARYRTKVTWMDARLRPAQITKDDDSTEASFAVIFNDPPYPLELEFRHPSSPVQGLYVVDNPNSTAIRSGDQIIRNYEEHVPIHIFTVDSTGCSGDALAHKMHAELRYISETYPEGSQRNLEIRRHHPPIDLGGMKLFHIENELSYVRNTTT